MSAGKGKTCGRLSKQGPTVTQIQAKPYRVLYYREWSLTRQRRDAVGTRHAEEKAMNKKTTVSGAEEGESDVRKKDHASELVG